MDEQYLKVFTHENIVHTQTDAIQKLLKRDIQFKINLNAQEERPSIQFIVSKNELDLLSNALGHTIFVKNGEHWRPYF